MIGCRDYIRCAEKMYNMTLREYVTPRRYTKKKVLKNLSLEYKIDFIEANLFHSKNLHTSQIKFVRNECYIPQINI